MSNDVIGGKVAKFLESSVAKHIARRREWLKSTAALDADRAAGTFATLEARRQAEDAAKIALGRAQEALAAGFATPRDEAEAKAALRREREQSAVIQDEVDAVQARAHASRAVADAVDRALNGLQWPITKRSVEVPTPTRRRPGQPTPEEVEGAAPTVRLAPQDRPSGPPLEFAAGQAAAAAAFRADIEETELAVPRLETAKRQVRDLVAKEGLRGAPRVGGAGEAGARLSIDWPRADIGAQPAISGNGNRPRPVDAAALACWLHPEAVIGALERDLEAAYEGALELDPHERQRRVRDLKRKILAAERLEAEAIWVAIEAGDTNARFRAGINPFAALGIAVD